ncbi:Proton-dependent oligopeptide transporter family [Corchorus capsularis]|uniref:Proton-dependent oligopeptide transporter family n=1 Tax=Corchorus capsularis TaxID=210143 RepID=A0A1R3JQD8_COCAP|nr:Proton-dependent oligopeptide transporter family [Corchorus capsularis]
MDMEPASAMELANQKMAEENGKEEEKVSNGKKLGGVRTMPFILANEMCDRFASSGFHSNMITYLTEELNMPLVQASNTLTNFGGTSSFTPLIGALIADSFAGRFWTIIVGSIIYELGLVSITISAILPSLRPPPCPTQENCQEASAIQLWILYICLLLTSLGTGGIRPCVVTFAADQFDMDQSSAARSGKWNFFNWYYFCMGIATLSALTVVVYIQEHVGWGWGLGIPTIAMAISIIAFVVGSPLYKKMKPGGSPLIRLAQVIVAAVKKRKEVAPEDPKLLYQNKQLDADIAVNGRLVHTNQYKWLDKAAIVTESEATSSNPPNLWRLTTVHRVEELKTIIRMLPIWAAGILHVASASHQHSFTIIQARSMDRHLSHSFEIPPASLSIFGILTMLSGLVLYERLFVPLARRFTGNPSGVTCLQRMGIGFMINILATMVSSFVEIKRKSVAANHNLLDDPKAVIPISVFWLVPQFCLHGVAEVFMSVGHLEFLYDQSPESIRSTAAALFWITIAIGNYIGTLMVSLVHKYSGEKRNWLPDRNLNRGRLECYYWLVSGIQVVNLVYYIICAWLYTYKPLEKVVEEEDGEFNGNDIRKISQNGVELVRNETA